MYPNFFFFTLCGLFVSDSDVTRFFMFFFGKESFMYPLIKVREDKKEKKESKRGREGEKSQDETLQCVRFLEKQRKV